MKHRLGDWDRHIAAAAEALASAGIARLTDAQRHTLTLFGQAILECAYPAGLTTASEPRSVVDRLILDSLLGYPLLANRESVTDIGTGPGIPGIPLAIAMPDACFTLVDSRRKAVSFLHYAIPPLGLGNVSCLRARVGHDPIPQSEAVVSRCAGNPQAIAGTCLTAVRPGGIVVLWVKSDLSAASLGTDCLGAVSEVRTFDISAMGHTRRLLMLRR